LLIAPLSHRHALIHYFAAIETHSQRFVRAMGTSDNHRYMLSVMCGRWPVSNERGMCLLCWLCGRDQSGKRHAGLISRVAGLWLALFAVTAVVPPAPGFQRSNFAACNANWCEISSTRHAGKGGALSRGEIAQFQKTQPLLLQQEFAGLTPSRKGETEIYTLAIAGWADLDVFVKELNGALAAMASVLPIKGRTVRLVNRRETMNTIPLANFHNFTAAVHAIGNIMDKDNDILILFMTSHGD